MKIRGHQIIVRSLVPPIADLHYFAKVLIIFDDESRRHMAEVYGETHAEAYAKAEREYQEWVRNGAKLSELPPFNA